MLKKLWKNTESFEELLLNFGKILINVRYRNKDISRNFRNSKIILKEIFEIQGRSRKKISVIFKKILETYKTLFEKNFSKF